MNRSHLANRPDGIRRIGITLFGAAIMAIIFTAALPAMAATQRGVNLRVLPNYPTIAKLNRLGGPVEINVTVDPNGKVMETTTLNGNPMLAAVAKTALLKWKFAPASATSIETVVVNFTYHEK